MDRTARVVEVGDRDATTLVRELLWRLMDRGVVQGLLVPLQTSPRESPAPTLIKNRERLEKANPLAPVMQLNSAKVAEMLLEQESDKRLGVVLRPCEARALKELADCGAVSLERLVTISIDCLGSHDAADYDQRINVWGADVPVRESLRWSRRGPIAAYRYRRACQICDQPFYDGADISIGLFGQCVSESLLFILSASLADQISLDEIDGTWPVVQEESREFAARRDAIDEIVSQRRDRRRRVFSEFAHAHEAVTDLLSLFEECIVCGACQEACPLTGTPFSRLDDVSDLTELSRHEYASNRLLDIVLRSEHCVGCGMCETACSRGIPLLLVTQLLATHPSRRAELVSALTS